MKKSTIAVALMFFGCVINSSFSVAAKRRKKQKLNFAQSAENKKKDKNTAKDHFTADVLNTADITIGDNANNQNVSVFGSLMTTGALGVGAPDRVNGSLNPHRIFGKIDNFNPSRHQLFIGFDPRHGADTSSLAQVNMTFMSSFPWEFRNISVLATTAGQGIFLVPNHPELSYLPSVNNFNNEQGFTTIFSGPLDFELTTTARNALDCGMTVGFVLADATGHQDFFTENIDGRTVFNENGTLFYEVCGVNILDVKKTNTYEKQSLLCYLRKLLKPQLIQLYIALIRLLTGGNDATMRDKKEVLNMSREDLINKIISKQAEIANVVQERQFGEQLSCISRGI